MPYMFIRHKVKDYDKWKSVFDEHGSFRKANGSRGGWLMRNADARTRLLSSLNGRALIKPGSSPDPRI